MAIEVIREKLSGDLDNASLPYYVHDPVGGPVTVFDAIAAAEADAPASLFGNVQDGNPSTELLVDNVYRITIRYNRGDYQTWVSTERFNIRANCEPWSGDYAPQINRFPSDAFDFGGVVRPGNRRGGSQAPFAPTVGRSYRVLLANLNVQNVRTSARLARAGAIHNQAFGAYALGELALCQFNVQQVDAIRAEVQVGWSNRENIVGQNRGGVAGVSAGGHDFVWETHSPETDRNGNSIGQVVSAVYVSRPRPLANVITPTGTSPP